MQKFGMSVIRCKFILEIEVSIQGWNINLSLAIVDLNIGLGLCKRGTLIWWTEFSPRQIDACIPESFNNPDPEADLLSALLDIQGTFL